MEAFTPDWWWLAYLALGLLVGLFAGMLGIGGGVVIVPLLVFLFTEQHFPADRLLHLALGTSIASIVFTGLSTVRAHHVRGVVRWDIVRRAGPWIVGGSLLGALFAERLSSRYLALIFTAFVLYSSVQLLRRQDPKPTRRLPGGAVMSMAALLIGGMSSLVGVAGGVIMLPLMTMCNVPMLTAIGTTAALGLPLSAAGTAGYLAAGLDKSHLPPLSLGYVYLPALAGLVVGTVVTVPFGARLAHSMPVGLLKKIFAAVLLLLAAKMLRSLF
ncbi:MAG TPA: sulfite exporter TauE/SafE family protein [Burkholderiales bacterium]|nr:sulfite exporter TauE/SafE family protein [Burkholderiales bacterium]